MDCNEIKRLIPIFLDGELEADAHQRVESHLDICAACRSEARALQSAWEMLGELDDIQPDPDYRTRFWARVAGQTSQQEKIYDYIKSRFLNRRLVPALAAAGLILGVALVATYKYYQPPPTDGRIAELSNVDLDMLDNIDLVENFDLIREIELLSDLEIIEGLDEMDA